MIDRSVKPAIKKVSSIHLLPLEKAVLNHGSLLHFLPDTLYDIFQIEWVFPAGKWYESKKGVAGFTARMMREGSTKHNALQLATMIDELGAEIDIHISSDYLTVKAMGITRHFESILKIMAEILLMPIFPEEELALKKKIALQQLLVNREKVEYLASKQLMETIYGKDHPYGHKPDEKDIKEIKREDLLSYHQEKIISSPAWIFLSGKVPKNFIKILDSLLSDINPERNRPQIDLRETGASRNGGKFFVKKDETQQDAIRMGRHLFAPSHPDSNRMKILTTILGGYFGSRLMSKIREEKGYTYGIYSSIQSHVHASFLYLATEVGRKYLEPALADIYNEIERLRSEPVREEELTLVRNYLMGTALNANDGPHKALALYKNLILRGKGAADFKNYIHTVQNISAGELLSMAEKYLDPSLLIEVVAGEK